MNWELFAAFLLITVVLLLTPGPIVTLVVATGAQPGHPCGAHDRGGDDARQRASCLRPLRSD